ncbi:MAG: CatB-related O-acetyltransferase [Clostridiaceae bacterium]
MFDLFKYAFSKVLKKVLTVPAIKNCNIHRTSKICSGSQVVNTSLDKYSYIGNFSTVVNCEIGSFCSISDYCIIGGAGHTMEWVSTSPVFCSGTNIMHKNFAHLPFNPYKKTIIGNDVWIGAHCLIKGGLTIGSGAIVGMGSVVTKNVEPYTIVAGVPATTIRKRFDKETISKLLDTNWWSFSDEKIKRLAGNMNDVNLFLDSLTKESE